MRREQPPIRVGILCDDLHLAAWQADCVRRVQELSFVEISLLIVNSAPPSGAPGWSKRLLRTATNRLLLWRIYERFVLNRRSQSTRKVPLWDSLQGIPKLLCTPVRKGKFRETFDEVTIELLESHRLDVLLRFGFGILTGDALHVAKQGIWSYHHGDPTAFRGAPPGFWEIQRGASTTGVVLQRLTEKLDGGVVLQAGWFKTIAWNYSASLDQVLFGAAHFVAKALGDLRRNPEAISTRAPMENPGTVFRYPTNGAMVRFLARTARAWLANQFTSLFLHQQWTLGVVNVPVGELFDVAQDNSVPVRNATWLPEIRGGFLADPFVSPDPQEPRSAVILAEEFDWSTSRGHISRVEWPFAASARIRRVISSRQHFSYPYMIENNGQLYCVPECAEDGAVRLFRWEVDTNEWLEDKLLIRNFPALDPTLFEHDGRWWLFCTSAREGPNDRLFGWHSVNLTGDWHAHPANPLKIDIRSARPAGRPFVHQGSLIRPAQDCSCQYGGAITFNRVVKLSIDEFHEQRVGQLVPDADGSYPAGLHTINGFGEWTIIDGARRTLIRAEMRRALSSKLTKRRRP